MANSMWHIQQKGFGFHGTITDVVKDERGEDCIQIYFNEKIFRVWLQQFD